MTTSLNNFDVSSKVADNRVKTGSLPRECQPFVFCVEVVHSEKTKISKYDTVQSHVIGPENGETTSKASVSLLARIRSTRDAGPCL